MSGNNPRKFKDRIALLAQKEAEGTAQFQEVMREVAEVKKPNCLEGPSPTGSGLNIPKHLNPMVLNQNAHYRIHGGSLPNVNQMVASGHSNNSGVHNTGYQGFVQCGGATEYSSILSLKQTYSSQVPERSRTTSMGSPGSGGGGAIRNRSGDRRWDTSPYGGERASPAGNSGNTGSPYYSASLSPYLSPPPPENRWRRTSSDSALYQSAAGIRYFTFVIVVSLKVLVEHRIPVFPLFLNKLK